MSEKTREVPLADETYAHTLVIESTQTLSIHTFFWSTFFLYLTLLGCRIHCILIYFLPLWFSQTSSLEARWNKFCVSCFKRLGKNRVGQSEQKFFFFFLKKKIKLKRGKIQLMCLKPGKTSAVTMHIKCIFGVKSAKKNFRVGPLLKGRSGNRKHKIYSIRPKCHSSLKLVQNVRYESLSTL